MVSRDDDVRCEKYRRGILSRGSGGLNLDYALREFMSSDCGHHGF